MKRILRIFVTSAALLGLSQTAFAQGCSQCLTYASAAGKKAQASLDLGIGVLLIPTLFLFAGILLLFVWRARAAASGMEAVEQSSPLPSEHVGATSYTAAFSSSATRAI